MERGRRQAGPSSSPSCSPLRTDPSHDIPTCGTRNEHSGQPYDYRLFAVRASVIMILFLWT